MQADFMSQELAKSGGIGIAATLARLDEAGPAASLTSLNERPEGRAAPLPTQANGLISAGRRSEVLES
jgi:hypothetical protein